MFGQKTGDIFESPAKSAIGQCISSDAAMSKGLAKLFVQTFPELLNLRRKNLKLGEAVMMRVGDRIVFNLVTKIKFSMKPKLATLEVFLLSLKSQAVKLGICMLSLPRLGCGLDRLNYDRDVKPLMESIFKGSSTNIVVYTLVKIDLFR